MNEAVMDNATEPSGRPGGGRLDPSWRQALGTPLVMALGAALLVQLLAALLLGSGSSLAPAARDTRLLAFEPDAVTAIEIRAGGDEPASLSLARAADGWVLPDLGDFPASETRVQQLLDSLAGLTRPLPVATSGDARARFKVADEAFERRITLRGADGEIGSLIVGDSPGFRRLFARLDGEDAIYDLRLALFDLAAESDPWIDRGRLQLERERITRIAGPDWTLEKTDAGWTLGGGGDGDDAEPDQGAVDDLLLSLSSLGYSGVLGTEPEPGYGLDAPVLTLELTLADGAERTYRLGAILDDAGEGSTGDEADDAADASVADYALEVSDDPYLYRLAPYELGDLLGIDRDRLLGKADDAAQAQQPDASDTSDGPAAGTIGLSESAAAPAATGADASGPVEPAAPPATN